MKINDNQNWVICLIFLLQSLLLTLVSHIITYLDQNILAETWKGILESIEADVMSLPHSAAHSIAHLARAAPLPVLTHTASNVVVHEAKCKNNQ